MRLAVAALVLAAAALLTPASAFAKAAPNPDPLWSEFPLQPLVETVPTSTTPTSTTPAASAPNPALAQPVKRDDPAARNDDRTTGFLILVGAAVAAGAGLLGRRRIVKRKQSNGGVEREPQPSGLRAFGRAGHLESAEGLVAVATRPRTRAAKSVNTLLETLSPQARLAEREREESHTELETHQVCEIACWRGYVRWRFYVDSEVPLEPSFSSPYFRAPGEGAPEQSDDALQAHAILVEKLVAAGWEPEGYGEEWFSERFQRSAL